MILATYCKHIVLERTSMFAGTTSPKHIAKMLKKILQFTRRSSNFRHAIDDWDEDASSLPPPENVKEGHFVVHAIDDGKLRRFVVKLSYLADPGFMRLLEQAEEEFGFKQEGVLAVPCRHSEMEKILESRKKNKK
ncbi:putative auxin-induced protein X15-like [Capsicum annuum]|nr:auxin-responsive protein SAUR50 isoform X1 [Capsicum annuum]KAF3638453.1 putative auxin-induced protein X15-like [Capsicum annuum]